MRIASYNVESLFDRPKALALPTWADGQPILNAYSRVNALLNEPTYTPAVKDEIVQQLGVLGLSRTDNPTGGYAILRQNRGDLLTRHTNGTVEIVAGGRSDWIGWVELRTEPTNELATRHTAMVMRDVSADILAVIEAESRVALRDFSSIMIEQVGGSPYDHVMLVAGNDDRHIDVGILTRAGYDLVDIRSHVDDDDGHGIVYSRDCPEYSVVTPSGAKLVVLVNHLKSKGYGNQADNDARRRRQAAWTAAIYARLIADGQPNVVVLGDFNDWPREPGDPPGPLAPLLDATDLKDVTAHPSFTPDPNHRPGTFENATKQQKFDYLLLSPALFTQVTGGGIFRKGVWGGTHGTLFPHYETMTKKVEQASDHAAIYADFDV